MIYILSIGGISIAIILYIIIRHYRDITCIQPETIAEYQDKRTKTQLLDDRFFRKINLFFGLIVFVFQPIKKIFNTLYRSIENKSKELESSYQEHLKSLRPVDKKKEDTEIKLLLLDAKDCVQGGKFVDAEKKYLEILQLDHYNIEAYKSLGDLYFEQKQYEQAKETYEHILKLDKKDDLIYHYLGMIALERGDLSEAEKDFTQSIVLDNQKAIYHLDLGKTFLQLGDTIRAKEQFQLAVTLEPSNPRNLDTLLSLAIDIGDVECAKETYKTLKEVNPDNGKLAEFKEKIKAIS